MRVLRMIREHRKPLNEHLKSDARFWPVWAAASAGGLALMSVLLGDPHWVSLAATVVLYGYAITFVVLGIASYRRSLGQPPPRRDKTYTRNDIWKRRWPWQ